jgi:enoyl-CoA hydratase/carnithine racemase
MVSKVACDWTDDCVRICFARDDANTLTTEVLLAFSTALDDARRDARSILWLAEFVILRN